MIRAILFDLDETLIDRNETMRLFLVNQHNRFPAIRTVDAQAFASECLRFQDNGYTDKLEAYSNACSSLGILKPGLPAKLFADLKDRYGQDAIAFDGSVEIVRTLSYSFTLGIVSNGRTRGQIAKIESTGLTPFFSAIVISEDYGVKKPHPSIFNACLEKLGATAQESIFIGDNPTADIAPAQALGMFTVWMRNNHYFQPESCDEIADNISNIPHIISRLNA